MTEIEKALDELERAIDEGEDDIIVPRRALLSAIAAREAQVRAEALRTAIMDYRCPEGTTPEFAQGIRHYTQFLRSLIDAGSADPGRGRG